MPAVYHVTSSTTTTSMKGVRLSVKARRMTSTAAAWVANSRLVPSTDISLIPSCDEKLKEHDNYRRELTDTILFIIHHSRETSMIWKRTTVKKSWCVINFYVDRRSCLVWTWQIITCCNTNEISCFCPKLVNKLFAQSISSTLIGHTPICWRWVCSRQIR